MLERFEDVGLIDDDAFAQAWVASRQRRKHLSRRALSAELQRKGVARDTASEALEAVSGDDEYAAALELAQSRVARLAGLDPQVQRRRLQGVLARRGFGAGIVARACSEALAEASEVDEPPDDLGL